MSNYIYTEELKQKWIHSHIAMIQMIITTFSMKISNGKLDLMIRLLEEAVITTKCTKNT